MDIYQTQKLLGDVVKKSYNLERVNRLVKQNLNQLVSTSEQIVSDQLDKVATVLASGKYKFMFLAGPSCSGKTTSTKLIAQRLKDKGINNLIVSLDDFFLDLDKGPKLPDGSCDKENITKIDLPFFNKFFMDIITNNEADMPEFDFETDKRKKELKHVKIGKKDIILVEGTHALNPKLLQDHSNDSKVLKVYACVNSEFTLGSKVVISSRELRLIRRITRDLQSRGESVRDTIIGWNKVCMGEDKYIKPFKYDCNFMVDTTHIYEPLVYDQYLPQLLEPVKDIPLANRLLDIFNRSGQIAKYNVPKNSLLWEFLVK